MSITDELRKFAWKECPSKFLECVIGIADDIDKQHEACEDFAHRLEDAASKGEEVTIFGTDYIPLPKDADGEAIHIGDEVVDWETPRLVVAVSEDSICLAGFESGSYYRMGIAKNYRHHHKPTVEDVLTNMHGELYEAQRARYASECTIGEYDHEVMRIIAEYAAKLRLAGEDA